MRKRRMLPALTLPVVILAVALGLITSKRSIAHSVEPTSVITIGSPMRVHAIQPGFLGLSLENTAIEPYAGTDPQDINPVFAQLIRNLVPGEQPVLRIGGDTTDWAWVPIPGMVRPGGVRVNLDQRWIRVLAALTRAVNAHLIVGVDLEANNLKLAAAEGQAFVSGLGGSVEALELGNEPELYGSFAWYVHDGHVVRGRRHGYDLADYKRDFSRFAAVLPPVPLAGPATGGPKWKPYLSRILSAEPRIRIATLHAYPLQQCYTPDQSHIHPSIPNLLASSASAGLAAGVAPYVPIAHAHGDRLRIDEMNSVSCGGAPGVSNSFASALWAADAVFQMARVGVNGVNIHTYPGGTYQLFTFEHKGNTWSGSVDPEYYGLLLFAQAAPPDSRLLKIQGQSENQMRTWATRAPDGQIRVLLINDGQSRDVKVRVPGANQTASLARLLAPKLNATRGITLGGQSFGSSTDTGLLAGSPTDYEITPRTGTYTVEVPAASAALLTLP